jgi:hypothetical protein
MVASLSKLLLLLLLRGATSQQHSWPKPLQHEEQQ